MNELDKAYDAKDFSSYRTFQKDELKELEKIRPKVNLRKEPGHRVSGEQQFQQSKRTDGQRCQEREEREK